MNLREKSLKGIFWTFSESIGIKLVSISTFFVLAKILGASAFGLVAIVNAFMQIANLFVEQGLIAALIQKKDLTEEHLNAAFWSNVIFGGLIFILLQFTAPLVANAYELPELTSLIRVASLIFLVGPSSLVHEAKLTKDFNFKRIALSRIIAILFGSATGLTLAFFDFGVWSLVVQQLSFVFVSSILIWYFNPWYPKLSFSFEAFKDIFSFSYKMFLKSVAARLSNSSTELILGYFLGPQAAGLYVFAYKIFQSTIEIVNSSINKIMLPLFSSIQQDISRVRDVFYQAIQSAYYFLFPLLTGIIFLSPYFVHNFFGEEWVESIAVLQWISIGGTVLMLFYYSNSIFIGLGRPEMSLLTSTVQLVLNVFTVVIASNFGLTWVAISQAITPLLMFPVVFFYLRKLIKVNLRSLLNSLYKPAVSSLGLCISFWGTSLLEIDSQTTKMIVQILVSLPFYVAALFIVRAEWVKVILNFIRRKKSMGIPG